MITQLWYASQSLWQSLPKGFRDGLRYLAILTMIGLGAMGVGFLVVGAIVVVYL